MKFTMLMSAAVAAVMLTAVNGVPSFLAPPEVSAQCPNPPGQFPLLLPNPTDCGSFYMCSWDNMAFLQNCPSVLHFNPTLQVCDSPEHFTCTVGNNPQNPPVIDSKPPVPEPESSEEDKDEGGAGGNAVVVTAPPEVSAQCPDPPGQFPLLLPNPTDCGSFYMCSWNNMAFIQHCPSVLHFNPTLQVCDSPDHFTCTVGNNNPPVLDSKPPAPEPEGGAGGNAGEVTAPPEVAAQCPPFSHDRVAMISDPTNCGNFYMCLETGSAVLKHCPAGLFFNLSLQVCDYPENVQCGGAPA